MPVVGQGQLLTESSTSVVRQEGPRKETELSHIAKCMAGSVFYFQIFIFAFLASLFFLNVHFLQKVRPMDDRHILFGLKDLSLYKIKRWKLCIGFKTNFTSPRNLKSGKHCCKAGSDPKTRSECLQPLKFFKECEFYFIFLKNVFSRKYRE